MRITGIETLPVSVGPGYEYAVIIVLVRTDEGLTGIGEASLAGRGRGVLGILDHFRDLLVGPRRYGELAAGLPRIPTNILAARLKELQAAGILRRAPRSRVIVYELTPDGRELEPVVLALGARGSTWPPDGARASTRVTIDVAALMISGSGSSRRWARTRSRSRTRSRRSAAGTWRARR